MLFSAVSLLSLVCLASGAAIEKRATAPSVTIRNGTVIGQSLLGIDTFKGIPFARPPTGTLRLKPPQVLATGFGTLTATNTPLACPSLTPSSSSAPASVSSALATTTPDITDLLPPQDQTSGEDCLTLNVQRPSGTNSSSDLPVLVWIYGGAFNGGSTQIYDASQILQKAISLDRPFVYVAMNYRLGAFGFLASKELSADGSTNLGLRDQRLAMQWVQDNIASFGGDPTKVTIWGESAGSISVWDQLIVNSGDNTYKGKPLFRGAIMDSGSTIPAVDVTAPKPQAGFNRLVQAAGCASAANKLTCLRSVSYETFLNAQNSAVQSEGSVDLPYLPRPDKASAFFPISPEIALYNGKYTKVPTIIGNQEDEGTLFTLTQNNITNTDAIVDFLAKIAANPVPSFIRQYVETYPEDPADGSPYRTGDLNQLYPGFKRFSSVVGDLVFILARRIVLDYISATQKTWSYLASYDHLLPIVGTTHATDVLAAYYGIVASPTAADEIRTRYISFLYDLDPNTIGSANNRSYHQWQQYGTTNRQLLQFQIFGTGDLADTFREDSYEVLKANYSLTAA